MVDACVIKLSGKEHIFHFNNYALIELGKVTGTDPIHAHEHVMNVGSEDPFLALTMVLYAGFVGYQKSQFNLNHGISVKDISQAVATCDLNEFTEAWESFKQSTGISRFLEEQAEIEAKKAIDNKDELTEKKKKSRLKASLNTPSAK